jgi:MarR family transcriptional regulator, lower aerobic nicotinate degradation pathway regulator
MRQRNSAEYACAMPADEDQIPSEVIDAVVETSFAVVAVLNRAAAEHDLSLTQLRLLGVLRDRHPTMSQLADFLGLDRSSVSGLIDRAVQRKLVTRDVSPDDRRTALISLTSHGQRQAKSIVAQVHGTLAPMMAGLNGTEQRRLTALLRQLEGVAGE